ncbi:MAG: guanylate kinase [Caldilineaceae bacterium]|nr:guanylate kinase [Caldilineaceae bacterium]
MTTDHYPMSDFQDDVTPIYARQNQPHPILVVLSGPSGVGKDTTLALLKQRDLPFHFVVTTTTRPRRPAEVDGVDYHFVSVGEFAELIDANDLLEYAVVYGDYKGIPKSHVRKALASGKDVILRIDVQGAATIRRLIPEAVTIFLVAESEEEQMRRLLERKTETPDRLKMRIATARKEMQHLQDFHYVVVNRDDRQEETVDKVISIIQAEKCRVDWSPVDL